MASEEAPDHLEGHDEGPETSAPEGPLVLGQAKPKHIEALHLSETQKDRAIRDLEDIFDLTFTPADTFGVETAGALYRVLLAKVSRRMAQPGLAATASAYMLLKRALEDLTADGPWTAHEQLADRLPKKTDFRRLEAALRARTGLEVRLAGLPWLTCVMLGVLPFSPILFIYLDFWPGLLTLVFAAGFAALTTKKLSAPLWKRDLTLHALAADTARQSLRKLGRETPAFRDLDLWDTVRESLARASDTTPDALTDETRL